MVEDGQRLKKLVLNIYYGCRMNNEIQLRQNM